MAKASLPAVTIREDRARYGAILRRASELAGLNRDETADALKVDKAQISRWWNGDENAQTWRYHRHPVLKTNPAHRPCRRRAGGDCRNLDSLGTEDRMTPTQGAQMTENTTPTGDILESMRAISVAATERHAALKQEMAALEEAFPELRQRPSDAGRVRKQATPEARAAQSERMRQRWAMARANGQDRLGPAVQ